MSRPAYVAMPGLSTVSVLLNLPCVAGLSGESTPIIIMDTHDYERLRGPPPVGDGQSAQKDQYLTMAYDDLRRRGIVRLVDYSSLYPATVQEQRLQQNRKLIEETPEWIIRQAAERGIERWTGYGRGEYQKAFRRTLGEDDGVFGNLRKSENQLQRKMKRGTGDPHGWIRKLLDKNIAALEVSQRANQRTDIDVRGVIGSSEHRLVSDFLEVSQPQRTGATTDILDADYDVDTDATHLEQLDPNRRIVGLDSTVTAQTREILEIINTVATDISGVQHNDWTLLGLSFALPQYNNLFDFDVIQTQAQHRLDTNALATETEHIIERLEHGGEETISPNKLTYEGKWVAEQHDTSRAGEQIQSRGLTDIVTHAVEIADHSRELRVLLEQNEVSQAAVFLATSIMNNPFRRYDEDRVYQRSMDLMRRLDPPSSDADRAFGWEREGKTWTENEDWYETADRTR